MHLNIEANSKYQLFYHAIHLKNKNAVDAFYRQILEDAGDNKAFMTQLPFIARIFFYVEGLREEVLSRFEKEKDPSEDVLKNFNLLFSEISKIVNFLQGNFPWAKLNFWLRDYQASEPAIRKTQMKPVILFELLESVIRGSQENIHPVTVEEIVEAFYFYDVESLDAFYEDFYMHKPVVFGTPRATVGEIIRAARAQALAREQSGQPFNSRIPTNQSYLYGRRSNSFHTRDIRNNQWRGGYGNHPPVNERDARTREVYDGWLNEEDQVVSLTALAVRGVNTTRTFEYAERLYNLLANNSRNDDLFILFIKTFYAVSEKTDAERGLLSILAEWLEDQASKDAIRELIGRKYS